jgi:hypothetical protein
VGKDWPSIHEALGSMLKTAKNYHHYYYLSKLCSFAQMYTRKNCMAIQNTFSNKGKMVKGSQLGRWVCTRLGGTRCLRKKHACVCVCVCEARGTRGWTESP